jgi:hypothetical protein
MVVLLSGVAVVWGLKTLTTKEVIGPVEAETTYGPIKLTVRLDKNVFKLGETVNVTVTITNINNETIELCTEILKADFAVYNSSSQIIYIFSRTLVTIGWGDYLFLEPFESYSRTFKWDQLEIDAFSPFASRQVQPGTYYIVGRIGEIWYIGPKGGVPPEFKGYITVETPKIEIQILSTA